MIDRSTGTIRGYVASHGLRFGVGLMLALLALGSVWLTLPSSNLTGGSSTVETSSRNPRLKSGGPPRAAFRSASNLRDGDLIFHESTSAQSEMVRALTGSRWTHMGVIFHDATTPMVFEAVSPVRTTPLKEWIARGSEQRYVVKRLREADTRLSSEVATNMRKLGTTWLGRPYDPRFRWDDEALYCSELAHKLFQRGAGVRLGKLQAAAEMNLDDPKVQQALRKRFAGAKFDPSETVVTPDSIFNDAQLVEIESR